MDSKVKLKQKFIDHDERPSNKNLGVMSTLDWAKEIFNLIGDAQRTCSVFEYEKREKMAEDLRRKCAKSIGAFDFRTFKIELVKIWKGEYQNKE